MTSPPIDRDDDTRDHDTEQAIERQAVAVFMRMPELVNGDEWLVSRGRYLNSECLIAIGSVAFFLSIASGRVQSLERGPQLMRPWRFAICGPARGWMGLWRPIPEPGWHDIFALTKRGLFTIEGDIGPLMANLQYFKDLLAAPRRIIGERSDGR